MPDDYYFFEIGYFGHPAFPYAHIQLYQATKNEYFRIFRKKNIHSFMIPSTTKRPNWVAYNFLIYLKNASITDLTNDDQKSYAFVPTYGYGSTAFHLNIISVVVFSYSNKPQSMFGGLRSYRYGLL